MAISYNKKKLIQRSHLLIFQELANNPSEAEIKIKQIISPRRSHSKTERKSRQRTN
jgi:hypothetical protein